MGADLSTILAVFAILADGDIETESWYLGAGPGDVGGLNRHSTVEADVSPNREDYYLGCGDNHHLSSRLFSQNVQLLLNSTSKQFDLGGAAENAGRDERSQLAECPGGASCCISQFSCQCKRSDGVEALVDVAQDGIGVEVRGTKLGESHGERVLRVDVGQGVGKSINGTVLGRATVPVLWPLLWHVLEVSGEDVELSTDDGADGFVVGNTTSTVGTVGEEVGVKGKGSKRDNRREWEVVEVRVVLLREGGVFGVLLTHNTEIELLAGGVEK